VVLDRLHRAAQRRRLRGEGAADETRAPRIDLLAERIHGLLALDGVASLVLGSSNGVTPAARTLATR